VVRAEEVVVESVRRETLELAVKEERILYMSFFFNVILVLLTMLHNFFYLA